MKFSAYTIPLTILLAGWVAAAETRVTVDEAVKTALIHNLDLQAATYRIDEARARLGRAGRLSDPQVETEFEPNVRGREYSFRAGFNQRFPVTGRLGLEKQLSRLHLKVAEAEVSDFRRKLIFEVHSAAVRVAALDENLRLREQQLQNTLAILGVNVEAAKVGEASELDTAQLELAADHLRLQQAQTQMQRLEENRALLSLLGIPPQTVLWIDGPLAVPQPVTPREMPFDSSVQASSRMRMEAAAAATKLAKAARWDDISVGLFSGIDRYEDLPDGLQTDHSVGLRLSVPIPLWSRRKEHIAEAETTFARLEREAEALKQHLTNETALAQEKMAAASRTSATIREQLLPKARQLEQRLLAFQKEGTATTTDILRARERRFELEEAEITARRDYHLARARYQAAGGNY